MIHLLLIFMDVEKYETTYTHTELEITSLFSHTLYIYKDPLSLMICFYFKSICFKMIILLLAKDSLLLIPIQVRRDIHKPQLHSPNISSFHLSKRFCRHIEHYLYSCSKQGSMGGIHTN